MARRNKRRTKATKNAEPEVIIRPLSKLGGLDNIHVTLIALVFLLLATLLAVSNNAPIIVNASNGTCANACVNATHTKAEVYAQVGKILATYNYASSWESIVPYFSDIQNATATFTPLTSTWTVNVPLKQPNANIIYLSFVLYDSNLSLQRAYIQNQVPNEILDNQVVSQGVVKLANKYECRQQTPIQAFWFIDPYAPGAVSSLRNFTALQAEHGNSLNASIKIVLGTDSQNLAKIHGLNDTEALSTYILCSSQQANFSRFVSTLNTAFGGSYISPSNLASIAQISKLNMSQLNVCMASAGIVINTQSLLAKYYNVTSTPSVVVNCMYGAIPQTADKALCYANSTFC